jgi:hypothetical protein
VSLSAGRGDGAERGQLAPVGAVASELVDGAVAEQSEHRPGTGREPVWDGRDGRVD